VKVGLFLWARNPAPWRQDWYEVYEQTLAQARLAEELGFAAVTTTEHHFAPDGYVPAPLTLAAGIAAQTKRVEVGTWIALLPLYHPIRFAESAATVDLISHGRLFIGLGLGYRWEEYEAFGVDRSTSGKRTDEAIEILVRALSGESVSVDGDHFRLRDVSVTPCPPRRPPIFLGQPTNPGAVRRVARWGLEGFAGAPTRKLHDRYLDYCAQYGTEPNAKAQWMLFGHCAPTNEQAWAEGGRHAQWAWAVYRDWWWTYGDTRRMSAMDTDPMWVIGDPQTWIDRINGRRTIVPTSHVFVCLQQPGMDHATVVKSMELFAREVLPHVQQ
jgi:alkanesulfonate monooxygenase SsuD/methylene tetrahydromethanopterin reductase-like flavin-dependent oxidoreductase (luciferase family)